MTPKIKLLNQDLTSFGKCQWTVGEWKTTNGEGDLCGPGWLHSYDSVELAVLLNPIHANIRDPIAYLVDVAGQEKHDRGMKSGYTQMRLIKPIPMPIYTTTSRIRFAIACSLFVYTDCGKPGLAPSYRQWAHDWIDGSNRSAEARAAAEAAAWAAEARAAWAAEAAAWAARAAADATHVPLQRFAEWALTDSTEVPA